MNCKYCDKICKNSNSLRNHERLCPSNKDRVYVSYTLGKKGYSAWNKGLSKNTDERVAKHSLTLKNTNKVLGKAANPEKEKERRHKISVAAKKQGFGGYREKAGHSQKYYYNDSFGKQVCLQSSYEMLVAKILDDHGVKWIRPKHLKYGNKKYYPDFYLVDFNVYLDPKNSFLAVKDKEKIHQVCIENNVQVFVLTKEQININFIKDILSSSSVVEQSPDKG